MAKDGKKVTVSMSIDVALLDAITADIDAGKASGEETDFSKWMRDAVRRKLRRFRIHESGAKYRAKRKQGEHS